MLFFIACYKKEKGLSQNVVIHDNCDNILDIANVNGKSIVLTLHAYRYSFFNGLNNTVLTDENVETNIGDKIKGSLFDDDKNDGMFYYTQFESKGFPPIVFTTHNGYEIANRGGKMSKVEFNS